MNRTAPLAAFVLVALAAPSTAHALQPLETFLAGARSNHPDALAADATYRQREAEVGQARGRLLPSFTARGTYTRNQFEVATDLQDPRSTPEKPLPPVHLIITPQNQLDALFLLDVPIVDLAQFARYGAQKTQAELADASRALTRRGLEERVVRTYYLFAATTGLRNQADRSLALAEKNRKNVADRLEAGLASELDLERANANVERAKQDVADALLSQQLAARNLETLSRVKPEAATVFPEDDLHDEGTLDSWVAAIDPNMPERRMSEAERKLAEASRDAAKLTFAPVLAAQAQERLTNATGFTGRVGTYALSATLTFRFDFGQVAQLDAAKAAQEGAVARAEGTRRSTEDTVAEAYNRINANLAKARAARAQAKATDRAAVIAEDRYQAGTSTELDVTQAQRDAFSANVARIQSDLDLAQARAVLRIATGKPLSFRNPGDKIQ